MAKMDLVTKLNPTTTAVVVIDIQNDFCSPDGLLYKEYGRDLSMMDPMIDKLGTVIPRAEAAGVKVLFTQQIYDREKLNELQKEQYDLDGKLITCDKSTLGSDFYRITPAKERVYVKYNFNIFSNPKLINDLVAWKIKTLVIVGVDAQYCVETAIRNGYDLGFKIVVPMDLVATNAKHQNMYQRLLELVEKTYGVVVMADDLIKVWDTYGRN